jgi:hypothetical protein
MRKTVILTAALFSGLLTASATVTVQGWWHYGEIADIYGDSSGNNRRFGNAFSSGTSGNAGAGISPVAVGGPLDATGWTSTSSLYWTPEHKDAAAMWNIGYNPPATNYVIECWALPEWPGTRPGNRSWLFASGEGGGVAFVLTNDASSAMYIRAVIINNPSGQQEGITIGDPVEVDTNRWTHLAVVNDNGTQTFYVNGVAHGAPEVGNWTVPAGNIYAGGHPGSQPTYAGYLDELRICTFAPGQFSTTNLLLRSAGPSILTQPQSATVWNGGAAPFSVSASFDTVSAYQWQRNGTNIPGANSSSVVLPQVVLADSGTPVRCILTGSSINTTSSTATLTVVAPNASNVNAYRSAVTSEPSLLAYFPVDNCTGTTVTNVADADRLHDGTLEPNGNYDGRTSRAFGQRGLLFNLDGDVTIPNNPAFEFVSGNGTIEALVYLNQATTTDPTIFSEAGDYGNGLYYGFRVGKDGSSLIFTNDNGVGLIWPTPSSLVGQWAHVAIVIDHGANVTAYANGVNLGTKIQSGFGMYPGAQAWIGSSGVNSGGNLWAGTIDEVAIYSTALSANTIAIHNSKFLFGTNTAPPTITGLPGTGSKTLLTGGSASFTVTVSGTPPLAYQWTTNGLPIPGATAATLTLSPTTLAHSGTYGVTVSNPYGTTNSPTFTLAFVAPGDSYATKVMSDNPSAYWRLDETGGTNGATAYDRAGGHDGTYVVTTATLGYYSTNSLLPGIADRAVTFTGYRGSDGLAWGCVEVPYSPVFNQNAPFSVECFSIPFYDGNDDGGALVSSYNRPGTPRQGWMMGASYNSVNYDFFMFDGSATLRQVNSAEHLYPNVLSHYVGVYDGTNAYIYINGKLSNTRTGPFTYAPNPSAALTIGARTSRYLGFRGVEDEVAFYGYALSANQISNHWSSLLTPAVITTQPVGMTNVEGSTITLTVVAAGYLNAYQWYKDGSPLSYPVPNSDGTEHYPQNVINQTLVIAQATPSDSGSYQLVVDNAVGGTNTIPVNVLITNDLAKPTVTYVAALATPNAPPNAAGPTPYLVKVLFSKRIDPYAGTYAIAGATISAVTVLQDVRAAALGADWREVILQTTGLTPGQSYTLNVSGVKDQTITGNPLTTTNITFRAPLLSQGLVAWDYYYLGTVSSPPAVYNLTSNPNYPNAPMTNWSSSTFDTTAITGGDINNNGFGSLGDNYGSSLSGWITPAVSGNYTFFLSSDDASELWLSTDANPQKEALIAFELNCCHGFTEQTNGTTTYTSLPIALQANTPYFIRMLHIEGGGGDWAKVAWRIAGDATPAASLQPIPGTYLSSYAPGPINFGKPVFSGGKLTLSWTGTGTLLQSTNVALPLSQWTPLPSATSPYQVTPTAGVPNLFYRLKQ